MGSDPGDEYLGVGIADSLITHLAGLPSVTVVSRSATLESGRRLSGTRALARDLGVTYVVNGGVQRSDNRIRVTLNLVRPDDSVAWGGTFEGTFDRFFEMQRRISEDLSEALQVTLTRAARERLARPPAASMDAYADYSKARALLERPDVSGNVERAIEGFGRALSKDPQFALAHAGLGEAYWARYLETKDAAWTGRAQASITEALRLDPNQPRTRFALALAYQGTGRADAALDELRRVLAEQPANDDAHRLLGDILADRGEWPEAIAELKRAVAIRPDYWRHYASLGWAYMKTGRYPEAIAAYTRITELQPDNSRGFQMVGFAYHNAGDNRRALENYRRAIEIAPDALAYQEHGHRLLRRRAVPGRRDRLRGGDPAGAGQPGDAPQPRRRVRAAGRVRAGAAGLAQGGRAERGSAQGQSRGRAGALPHRRVRGQARLGTRRRRGTSPARWPSSRPTATSSIARRWCTRSPASGRRRSPRSRRRWPEATARAALA